MKNLQKKGQVDLVLIIPLIIFTIIVLWFSVISFWSNQQTFEYNVVSCGTKVSCFCRDTCAEIYGHSDWESWLYKRNGECWCIEKNETKRVF